MDFVKKYFSPTKKEENKEKGEVIMPITVMDKTSKSVKPYKEEIDLSCLGKKDLNKTAFLVKNLLSEEECANLIKLTESVGYVQAMVNAGHKEVLMTDYRRGKRCIIDDVEFAKIIYERLEPFIPMKFKDQKVDVVNERMRFLKYEPGDFFKMHCDGAYNRPDFSSKSLITIQIYLKSVERGGETNFINQVDNRIKIPIVPQPGLALLFQHDLLHEGAKITKGVKYTFRTEVMYKIKRGDSNSDSE